MRRVNKQKRALRDLEESFVYLAENAGLPMAELFLENAESSFSLLAEFPDIGSPVPSPLGTRHKFRKLPIKDFAHLIFYTTHPDMIVVVRVLHQSQDYKGQKTFIKSIQGEYCNNCGHGYYGPDDDPKDRLMAGIRAFREKVDAASVQEVTDGRT